MDIAFSYDAHLVFTFLRFITKAIRIATNKYGDSVSGFAVVGNCMGTMGATWPPTVTGATVMRAVSDCAVLPLLSVTFRYM